MCWNEERHSSNLIRTTLIFFYTYIVFANDRQSNNRYILIWTNPHHFTHPSLQKGNKSFVNNQCRHQNCFLSNKYTHVARNLSTYDAILFNAVTLRIKPSIQLPKKRSKKQKYILVSAKSAADFPVSAKYNNFFHWTWTYKLNSDISNAYIVIKNKDGEVIGPKQDMHWITVKDMNELTTNMTTKLKFKTTAAAWIISNCDQKTQHSSYVQKFKTELEKHNHTLDIFGTCGDMNCPEDNIKKCYTLLESKYYFYLSFENSMAEDYVTDQLLTALNNFAVPLVFGGANYTRFMPEGIYLNALELGPIKLASKINDIIENRKAYYDMFKWHNYYSFYNPYENPDTNGICELCKLLNNEKQQTETKVYENIVTWFNDLKDWNLEDKDEKVRIKHITENQNIINFQEHLPQQAKKQLKNETLIHIEQNKVDQTIDKPEESQDVRTNLESENPSLDEILYDKDDKEKKYLVDRNDQKTSPPFDKSYEDSTDGFAEVIQMRNIIKNDLYNDLGLEILFPGLGNETEQEAPAVDNNEHNNSTQYSTENESIIDLIKRLEKEDLSSTENVYTTEVLSPQNFGFTEYQQISNVEKTTKEQQQITNQIILQQTTENEQLQTTTIKKNNKNIEELLKNENEILKDALKHFEKMILLNKQQLSIRNESNNNETVTQPINVTIYDDVPVVFSQKAETTDTNNNQTPKLDFDNMYHSTNDLEETTRYSMQNYTAEMNSDENYDNDDKLDDDENHKTVAREPKNRYDQNENVRFDILIWTNSTQGQLNSLEKGNKLFIGNKCKFRNCILSNRDSNVTPVTKYDVVIFDAVALRKEPYLELPRERDIHQKYVLVSGTSAANCPITSKYNNFFNWTWTYKLNSDISFPYIVIKNKDSKVIGPAKNMHWMPLDAMVPTNEKVLRKLQNKTTAAAWIMPHCEIIRKYEYYITELRNELRRYGHILNIFGNCGNMKCPKDDLKACYKLLEKEYYFYLSFEDSMAEDYVTDQLLTALNNLVVPLVFGGGNYTRFMPKGIYLDALELGPVNLARTMCEIIRKRQSYNDMFRWHNHYSYHDSLNEPNAGGLCTFCATLNDKPRRKQLTVYKNIVKWFNDRKDWNSGPETEGVFNNNPVMTNSYNNKKNEEEKLTTEDFAITEKYTIENDDDKAMLMREKYGKMAKIQHEVLDPLYEQNVDYDNIINRVTTHSRRDMRVSTKGPNLNLHFADAIPQQHTNKQYEQAITTTSPTDTSIRCPDIVTCVKTIVSNVQSKIASLL